MYEVSVFVNLMLLSKMIQYHISVLLLSSQELECRWNKRMCGRRCIVDLVDKDVFMGNHGFRKGMAIILLSFLDS